MKLMHYARWRLFGHVLRMDASTPARQAMLSYFQKGFPGRSGNFATIATNLSRELKSASGKAISSEAEYNSVLSLAQDRVKWKEPVDTVQLVKTQCVVHEEKRRLQREKRKEREQTRLIK